jgi:hypothetical protein
MAENGRSAWQQKKQSALRRKVKKLVLSKSEAEAGNLRSAKAAVKGRWSKYS